VIRGRPGGLFQFSGGGAIRIILAFASSSALNYWESKICEALASSSVTKIVNGDMEQVLIQRGTCARFSL